MTNCVICEKPFLQKKKTTRTCGPKCNRKLGMKTIGIRVKQVRECLTCKKETTNSKFCSRTCSTINSNKVSPRRIPTIKKSCVDCGVEYFLAENGKSRCDNCYPAWKNRWNNMTLGKLTDEFKSKGVHRSYALSELRSHCRILNKFRPMACQVCGYDKHVEMCHIKPVSSFDSESTLIEINHPSNVYVLCRNHHWEFDHNMLDMTSFLDELRGEGV